MWERFEELMKANKLRIADVARETGISYSTFTDWKAGRYRPKIEKINAIANFFGVSPSYLLGRTDDPHRKEEKRTIYINTDIIARAVEQAIERGEIVLPEEESTDNPNDAFFESLSDEQKEEITRLYQKYQNASPEVRSAVELLLKAQSQES